MNVTNTASTLQLQHETLLRKTAVSIQALRKAKEIFSDRLAPDFNLFDFLRSDEIGLSRCISSLLNPKGKHGQGCVFLSLFAARFLPQSWDVDENCAVTLEKQTSESRRIDIYLRLSSGNIIGIENKPWAGDQPEQLSDYATFIATQATGKAWHLFYLSNYNPSEKSLSSKKQEQLKAAGHYSNISFHSLISWLEECSNQAKASQVKLFIDELVKFIKEKINGELDMTEENEVKSIILATEDSLESAFAIANSLHATKQHLLKQFRQHLESEISGTGFTLIWDKNLSNGWQAFSGFGIQFDSKHKFYLRFEFDNSNLRNMYWGICRLDETIQQDSQTWLEINTCLNKLYGNGGHTEWWLWWAPPDNHSNLGSSLSNWDSNVEPWKLIQSNSLAPRITQLAGDLWQKLLKEPRIIQLLE